MDLDPEGDLPLFPCLGLLAGTNTLDVAMASHGRGTDFSIQDHGNYRGSWVNLRLYLVFPISSLLLIGFWTNLVLTEAIHQENLTPYVTGSLERNSPRKSDNTGIAPPGHIYGYWRLPYWESPI